MATITPVYFTFETTDGEVNGPIRVLAVDKIAAEQTCRHQGWPWQDTPRIHSVMGFYAAKRAGATTATDYPAFMTSLVDFNLTNTRDDDEDTDEDPTTAATSAP